MEFSKIGLLLSRNKGWYSQEIRLVFLKMGWYSKENGWNSQEIELASAKTWLVCSGNGGWVFSRKDGYTIEIGLVFSINQGWYSQET